MDDRILGRRYRLTEKIGSGGMADVFKAQDEVLGRTVAAKVMHPKYAAEEGFVDRFRQEAQAAANLSHPNIVNIFDWGREDDETYYIIMEYVRGTDLKSYLGRHGKADPRSAANWAAQVCTALSVAHGYGIIHRDIKPHNLVLMHDENVKVMDFGIARAGDTTMTQTGSVLGTAQYVSPEQAQGKDLGPGSDLYSLGIVLYELVTGKLPFEGDSAISIALKQVNEEPLPPRQVDPTIPPELEAIIMQAIVKDPARRYHAADEMRADLKRFLSGEQLPVGAAMGATQVMGSLEGQDEYAGEDLDQPRKKGWIWTLAIIVALALAGVAIAWAMGVFDNEVTYTVPSVVGMEASEATQTILAAGLAIGDVTQSPSEEVQAGRVISQDPDAGSTAEASATVDIVVSTGVEMVAMPDLSGMPEADAITAVRGLGLVDLPIQREYSADVEIGLVLRQLPEAGTMVEIGTEVTVIVSQGTQLVQVPDVSGQTQTEAQSLLQDAGLAVSVNEQFSDTVDKDRVISQSPGSGVSIEVGSTVTIVVSKGPDLVDVPNVKDELEADAVATIENAGLTATVQYIDSPFDGQVLEQWPIAGASVERGSEVTLTVGKTPAGP